MSARLYCRDCGWHPTYRRRAAALRAARRHRCPPPAPAVTIPTRGPALTDHHQAEPDEQEPAMPHSFPADRDRPSPVESPRVGSRWAGWRWHRRPAQTTSTTAPPRTDEDASSGMGWLREQVLTDYHANTTRLAREATIRLVRAGYHVGPVPFGYRPRRIRTALGADSPMRWRTRLVIEPVEAATACMIFAWRVEDHLPPRQIIRCLIGSRYPAPISPATGQPVRWSRAVLISIISNPVYTGREVWGRHHDGQPVPPRQWVISQRRPHLAVITDRTFLNAQPHPEQAAELAAAMGVTLPPDPDEPDSDFIGRTA